VSGLSTTLGPTTIIGRLIVRARTALHDLGARHAVRQELLGRNRTGVLDTVSADLNPSSGELEPPIDHVAADRTASGELEVRILMFGMICQITTERQTMLRLRQDATVRDVIRALGDRYGAPFLGQVMRTASCKASHSAIAVDGYVVRDLDQPLAPAGTATATVEIILLPGPEGG